MPLCSLAWLGSALLAGLTAPPSVSPAPPSVGPAVAEKTAIPAVVSGDRPTKAKDPPDSDVPPSNAAADPASPPPRRFLVGLEGVVMQMTPLRPEIVSLDPRALGRTVALGGLGVMGRYRPYPRIALEVGIRSGSLRYTSNNRDDTDDDDDSIVSQDHVLADAGVLLYVTRGEQIHLAIDGGLGGVFNRVRYELSGNRTGTQRFGSASFRVGVDVELVVKRVVFVASVRAFGLLTDRERITNRGELLTLKSPQQQRAPVPTFQTTLVVSAGVAYRF